MQKFFILLNKIISLNNKKISKKGSAAILLSLTVSGAVLATIFITQKSANLFMASLSQNLEEWEYNFASTTALTIGGYLVSNNLILCKKNGWKNEDQNTSPRCKWNDHKLYENTVADKKSSFSIKDMRPKQVQYSDNAPSEKVFRLKGEVFKELINPQSKENIEYEITFDLVNWKESIFQNLLGSMPESVCRNTKTLQLVTNGVCNTPKKSKHFCKNSDGNTMPNTVCEYISDFDQDYNIVLMSVTPIAKSQDEIKSTIHAGVRRPVAIPLVEVVEPAKCELSCATNAVPGILSQCRDKFRVSGDDNLSAMKLRVTNQGPGILYKLSLLRTDKFLDLAGNVILEYAEDAEGVREGEIAPLDPDDPTKPHSSVTQKTRQRKGFSVIPGDKGDLLSQNDKFALMPGEFIEFQDHVDCNDSTKYYFNQRTVFRWQWRIAGGTDLETNINIHSQPFMKVEYAVDSFRNPQGTCMIKDDNRGGILLPDKDHYMDEEYCNPGGDTPVPECCKFTAMEPSRSPKLGQVSENVDQTHTTTEVTIVYIPPH